jgi:hypothetical protein
LCHVVHRLLPYQVVDANKKCSNWWLGEIFNVELKKQLYYLSAFRPRRVPRPTSKFVAACPSPDGLAQDGTQGGNVARVISHQGGVLVVGVTSVRERERVSLFVSSSLRATLSHEGPGPPFYRCKERVQVYNGGGSYALTCLAERCLSPVYMPTWLSERC